MQLIIENCGRIGKADIEIKGITVIAGDNNTGKSTIGKILYSVFNSFYDLDKKIFSEKIGSINRVVNNYLRTFDSSNDAYKNSKVPRNLHMNIKYEEKDSKDSLNEKVIKSLDKLIKYYEKLLTQDDENKLRIIVNERLSVENESIMRNMFTRFIKSEFEGQINNLNVPQSDSKIELYLKGKSINIEIENNIVKKLNLDCKILTEAVYIDSPFVLDQLSETDYFFHIYEEKHRNYLESMLRRKEKNNLIDEVIVEKKINEIIKKIDLVAPNASIASNEDGYTYKDETLKNPLKIYNISTGLKTFIIIKMLIENFTIQENGVLILDEPEIHLHPEWQLIFAEIIVLLQKELNLHIILNTHSPYFLSAIEVYSAKYCITDKCKYYLSCNEGNISTIKDVTNNVQEIYEKLAMPFQRLESLRANIGDCND